MIGSNRILNALPRSEYDRIAGTIETVKLASGTVLGEPGEPATYVYFPNDAIGSLISITEDGKAIEAAMVGSEGLLGVTCVLGVDTSPYRVMAQISGTASRMNADTLREQFNRQCSLHDLLLRYTSALLAQITQSAVCNRFHTLEQRLCRWLLTAHDRLITNEFTLTHEFLSYMLGSRRQGVTESAGALQNKGLIRYVRGQITVLDRLGLESFSCECHRIVKEAYYKALRM